MASVALTWSLVTGEARTAWLFVVPAVAGTVVGGGFVAGAGETAAESGLITGVTFADRVINKL